MLGSTALSNKEFIEKIEKERLNDKSSGKINGNKSA